MDLKLENRVILVTGGASGIGASICRRIVEERGIAVILDRNVSLSESLARELSPDGDHCDWLAADLTDEAATREAFAELIRRHGRLDGLVNNAGLNDRTGLDGTVAAFRQSLEGNLVQVFLVTQLAMPYLKKSAGAAIVNIASKVAVTGQGGTSGYAAAKGGVASLTREWALELAQHGIRVNCVFPAEVWTPLYEKYLAALPFPDSRKQDIEDRIPLGQRMTETAEIADTTLFLLSSRSSHTTGQWLFVDGGYTHLDRAYTPPPIPSAS
ncbi:MAG: SDR family oxidoreductase [Akkermansiaceae bacterium]|nr:SDR family oxidoreductase [Akkermansiaceae bacterium]